MNKPIDNSRIEQNLDNSQVHGPIIGKQGDKNVQIQGKVVNVNQGTILQISRETSSSKALSAEELRFRKVLLNKLRKYWIEEVLQKSLLYEHTNISIRWRYTPNQVKHSFSNHQEFSKERQKTSNTEVYDEFVRMGAGRTLLILGKPGVGKTTILLKLLEGLIQAIENEDLNQEIPVVFNLSSQPQQYLEKSIQ